MAGMTVIECAGSPLEMGRAHREQARPVVRRALEAWREVTARPGVAGLLGLTGVNAAGVAVCVNTLGMLSGDP
ncbi:hypothetical protein ACI2LC_43970 [Nonomuraea wenchangensis]|uniref:hypothetical protein n=1 Tax=Nonomuraea wenchangensis TaxID=568860 RepID=UPI0038509F74